jgi:hypothetical protein
VKPRLCACGAQLDTGTICSTCEGKLAKADGLLGLRWLKVCCWHDDCDGEQGADCIPGEEIVDDEGRVVA